MPLFQHVPYFAVDAEMPTHQPPMRRRQPAGFTNAGLSLVLGASRAALTAATIHRPVLQQSIRQAFRVATLPYGSDDIIIAIIKSACGRRFHAMPPAHINFRKTLVSTSGMPRKCQPLAPMLMISLLS